jgi:phosphatidylserine/phosphatidylglycerophosphate/cardiolipin synthase-like enzyme
LGVVSHPDNKVSGEDSDFEIRIFFVQMLIFPVTAPDLVPLLDSSRQTILVQSASAGAPPILDALARARKRGVKIELLLGPKPSYTIDGHKVVLGSRPYEAAAGLELARLRAMGASYLINPRFNALRGTEVVHGVESHATYVVVDGNLSLVCTGPLSDGALTAERNVCIQSDDATRAKALSALFYSEFDETLGASKRAYFERVARSRLIVCPSCEAALLAALADVDELTIRVAGFGSLPKFEARLLQFGSRLRVLLPLPYRGQHPFEETLRRAGVQIRFTDQAFDGLASASRSKSGQARAIVGSLQLNTNSLSRSREVGVALTDDMAKEVEKMLEKAWSGAR